MEPRHHLHGDAYSPSHSPQQKAACPRLSLLSLPHLTPFLTDTGQAAAEVLAGGRARGGSLAMGHGLVLVDLSLPGLSLPLVCDGDTINLLCKDRSQEMSWV